MDTANREASVSMALPGIDRDEVLRYLKLPPNEVATQALLLICTRYSLDPLLKHIILISGRPYVTRDGYLHVAHASEQLDGIELVDEGETDTHWTAKVAVYRKDMAHPFAYSGRYPKTGQLKQYGPEMAVKTAEVMALRRAFAVTGVASADERWDDNVEDAVPADPLATPDQLRQVSGLTHQLTDEDRAEWVSDNTVCGIELKDSANRIVATARQASDVIDALTQVVEARKLALPALTEA